MTLTSTGRLVEAPERYIAQPGDGPRVFLAGGITHCPDWQNATAERLTSAGAVVFNPRRRAWTDPARSAAAAVEQVDWETEHLWHPDLDLVVMWFPASDPAATTQPIAMFELGALARDGRDMLVGIDVTYPRALDVLLLMHQYRPGLYVFTNLDEMIDAAIHYLSARDSSSIQCGTISTARMRKARP